MIGKLHPLVVHLPIGFIYLAFLLEVYVYFRKPDDRMTTAVKYGYIFSTIVAAIAVISGLLLASDGKFTPAILQTHKWLGISVLLTAGLVSFVKSGNGKLTPKTSLLFSTVLIVLLSVAGHYGGMLTHGKDYVFEEAPAAIQKMVGLETALNFANADPDSVLVYDDVIKPVLNRKCGRCHNQKYPSGGLIVTDFGNLIKGGEDAEGIVPGKPYESAVLTRTSLPVEDSRFMPPDGKVLSQTEHQVLKYWITLGADTTMRFDSRTIQEELRYLLMRDFDLDYTLRPHYEKVIMDSIGSSVFNELEAAGFQADFLGENNFFLDVKFQNDTLFDDGLRSLYTAADHVAFLDISSTHLVDTTLEGISLFENLVRLDLHNTNISSSALRRIADLQHLEVLNLHHTQADYNVIIEALAAPQIKTIYLWETRITEEQITSLRMSHPSVQIVGKSVLEVQRDTTDASEEKTKR